MWRNIGVIGEKRGRALSDRRMHHNTRLAVGRLPQAFYTTTYGNKSCAKMRFSDTPWDGILGPRIRISTLLFLQENKYETSVACMSGRRPGCSLDRLPGGNPISGPATSGSAEGNLTLVTLKVPNMTWGGCAASVRGALQQIDGVTDIETDPGNRVCSFKLTKPDVDYQAKLADLAKTNTHLAGYEIQ
jgi:copper chaperone CopZ